MWKLLDWLNQSPDLNPTENAFHPLKKILKEETLPKQIITERSHDTSLEKHHKHITKEERNSSASICLIWLSQARDMQPPSKCSIVLICSYTFAHSKNWVFRHFHLRHRVRSCSKLNDEEEEFCLAVPVVLERSGFLHNLIRKKCLKVHKIPHVGLFSRHLLCQIDSFLPVCTHLSL